MVPDPVEVHRRAEAAGELQAIGGAEYLMRLWEQIRELTLKSINQAKR